MEYNKFTNNNYKNVKLNEEALPIVDKREYKILLDYKKRRFKSK